jgi:hypothetical protein
LQCTAYTSLLVNMVLIPYVEQDLQTADNKKKEILLLLYLPIVAIPALGHITIITILMAGEESKT